MRNESDRERITRTGREALKRLDSDRNWPDWLAVGKAILIGREECKQQCGLADTNLPAGSWGRAYNRAFGEWLAKEKLDLDKGNSSRLLEVMDNLPAIEAWLMTLTLPERRRLNHPSIVLRKWKVATQPTELRLQEEVRRLAQKALVDAKAYIDVLEARREATPGAALSVDQHFDAVIELLQDQPKKVLQDLSRNSMAAWRGRGPPVTPATEA